MEPEGYCITIIIIIVVVVKIIIIIIHKNLKQKYYNYIYTLSIIPVMFVLPHDTNSFKNTPQPSYACCLPSHHILFHVNRIS
jgi:hypothetical protein